MRISAAVAVACLTMTGLSMADQAQAAARKSTNISAQGLGPALQLFAKERDIQLVYRSEFVADRRTGGAAGELTVEEALTQLLSGTGLTYQHLADDGITIVPIAAGASTASASSSSAKKSFLNRFRLAQSDASTGPVAGEEGSREAETAAQGRSMNPEYQRLEEIVVTAQKREERLQDVPISISVLSGEQLDRSTARGVSEMLNRVPGVMSTEASPGGATQLRMRGVSASYALSSGSSPVGYYLDSVPFGLTSSAILPDTNAYDMDRVEVLRGPQGTLYGANSMAGVVRVLTREADLNAFELKGRAGASSTEGGSGNYRGDMAVNVPLVEGKLAARLVAGHQSLSGWLDKPIERNANDAEISNFRLKINGQLNDRLSIGASVWRSRADYGAPSIGRDSGERSSFVDEPMSTDFDAYGLKAGYDFPAFSVISMTSYLDYVNDSYLDLRMLRGVDALGTFHYNFPAHVFAQEFNLVSTHAGPWRWSLGGLYRDGKDDPRYFSQITGPQVARTVYSSESIAVFGELTRIFLDGRFELAGGLRYFEDRVRQIEHSTFSGAPAAGLFADETFDSTTPRIVLTWHPGDQATLYASYAEGFRSGRAQSLTALRLNPAFEPIEPDTLKNYELGAKGSVWRGRLNYDSALYYLDWQDIQQQISVFDPTNSTYIFTLVNSGSANGLGFDFGVTAELIEGLTLSATFSTNDLEMDTDILSGGLLLFSEGDRPNLSPRRTIGASLDYTIPLGGNGYQGRFSASANYVSSQTNRQLSGTVVTVDEGDTMMIGRASFSLDAPAGWSATVFVDNINNEEGSPITLASNPVEGAFRVRPRTIGAQIEYRFGRP